MADPESPRSVLWRETFLARMRVSSRPDGHNAVMDAATSADTAVDFYDKKFPAVTPPAPPAAKPAKERSK